MFWADALLKNRTGKEWVNDAWTPSGIVHMGGLKGPIIHDTLYRIIKEQGRDANWTFGLDDADPIDGLPPALKDTHSKYLGIPVSIAPSPDGNGTFGDYYGNKLVRLFKQLGIKAQVYKASEYYKKGTYNKAIEIVLNNAQKIRDVYGDIYKKTIPTDWFPLQVICEKCGKLGTTKVNEWDGKEVSYVCEPNLVKWAQGCGHKGKISPFNGNAKMPWKIEWAAKWWTLGVTIEGAGKDHASAGGSYDVATKICLEVFNHEPPLKIPYEFFLYDGKKMASSKGIGLTGEDLLEVMPPEMVRFLMIKTPPNQAVEFNPYNTEIIPKLYDDFQAAVVEYSTHQKTDHARAFELSKLHDFTIPTIRFKTLAQWVQMPNMDEKIKEEGLEEWAGYAKVWVEKYAPELEKFLVQKKLPEAAKIMSDLQKKFLQKVSSELDKRWDAEEFQKQLYEWAQELDISSKDAFAAIYTSLIGKNHGPKAGWLILSLDKEFIKKRFKEVASKNQESGIKNQGKKVKLFNRKDIFTIDSAVKEKYPSVSIGVAIIKEVSIEKTNTDLEKEKATLLGLFDTLTTEQLSQYPEVLSYRKLYKEMGIDWHSRRPSPEALLRRVALKKGLYTINTCVDAYNLVVMKHKVSIGAFDVDTLEMPTVLRFPKEGEKILLLGDTEPTQYKPTELAYFDQKGGFNIDFNYRDAQRTAVQQHTKNLYINVDGVYDISPKKVEEVLQEACDMIMQYCGGTLEIFGVETAS